MTALPNLEDWIVGSNDAFVIKLLAPEETGLRQIASFHPVYTYQIFEEEQIFGYKNPKIELRYRANDMRPHLKISQSAKLQPMGEAEPTDIAGLLVDGHHLPKVAFAKERDFEDSSIQLANNWTPPGQLDSSYTSADGTYEIWKGRLDDPAVKQLNLRVQILVPMFIEGGSYIGQRPDSDSTELDLSDADRWTVFFLYRKTPVEGSADKFAYTFAGFSTVYRFYYFQPPTPPASPADDDWELPKGDMDLEELPCRTRLSQFIILPPFQKKGNGSYLYKAIFEHYLKHPQTQEFTVEDPNEAFDDLRDICDLAYLRTIPEFAALRLDASVTLPKAGPIPQLILGGDKIEAIRHKAKIAPRQFNRVLEMYLMSQLPDSVRTKMPSAEDGEEVPMENGQKPTKYEEHLGKLWGLVAKQRLYRHNKDVLSQIDLPERKEKLEQTLGSVGLDYARVLALYERAEKHQRSGATTNGKRKVEEEVGESSSKRARTEDA